jgi:hypothetical protein
MPWPCRPPGPSGDGDADPEAAGEVLSPEPDEVVA